MWFDRRFAHRTLIQKCRRPGAYMLLAVAALIPMTRLRAQIPERRPTVVFICEHGAAKSVIAAAYFNRLAAERHLNFHAVARGISPQRDLSVATVAGLRKEDVPFPNERPRRASREELNQAVRVVAFCPVPASLARKHQIRSFDVPAPNDGYDASRDAILVHVRNLIDELASAHDTSK